MERIVDERKKNWNLMNKKSWFACDLVIEIFLRLPVKSLLWFRINYPHNGKRLISSDKFVNGKLHWATTSGLCYERE
ncbi:hypothetical protein H5410_028088 [Solanum commersonii]|uniref:Uncharacterized protein n=1 Tax=Solanum commersonii TaxID=4109 RepID=A0A9J5Z579_SOLCO|nr:hypothetical protein H5410_028088 [Solanum commersonii]